MKEIALTEILSYTPKRNGCGDYSLGGWYMIVRNSDGRKYVGKSVEVMRRLREHTLGLGKTEIDKAISAGGAEAFSYFIIADYVDMGVDFFTRKLEGAIEQKLIAEHNSFGENGFNKRKRYYERVRTK